MCLAVKEYTWEQTHALSALTSLQRNLLAMLEVREGRSVKTETASGFEALFDEISAKVRKKIVARKPLVNDPTNSRTTISARKDEGRPADQLIADFKEEPLALASRIRENPFIYPSYSLSNPTRRAIFYFGNYALEYQLILFFKWWKEIKFQKSSSLPCSRRARVITSAHTVLRSKWMMINTRQKLDENTTRAAEARRQACVANEAAPHFG